MREPVALAWSSRKTSARDLGPLELSAQLTMDTYLHMIPALRNEVADRMDEIFSTTVNEAVKSEPVIPN